MQSIDYHEIIEHLNHQDVWLKKPISLELSSDQYIALLKGYQPHWEMRFGILYNFEDQYFYAYRSGFVVGKYRFDTNEDNGYSCLEMYDNPDILHCEVIFEIIREACYSNRVEYDFNILSRMLEETRSLNHRLDSVRVSETQDYHLSPSDPPFTAKARKLQSMWRMTNCLEMGYGPTRNSKKQYGNMLADGESNGRNFYFPETFEYAKWRVNSKLKDETIDEYRLFNNLMSSMPMAFNLFHPLMMLKSTNPQMVDDMFRAAFPDLTELYKVTEIGLEFIPTPIAQYTGDKSAMDAFVRFQDKAGNNFLIAIETKYTDSLGTNTASEKAFDKQLAIIRELNMFTEEGLDKIAKKEIPITQIYRNFILAEKYGRVHGLQDVFSVVLAPKDHPTTKTEVASLQQYLKREYRHKITSMKLEDFVGSMRKRVDFGKFGFWLDWFRDRYLNFERE